MFLSNLSKKEGKSLELHIYPIKTQTYECGAGGVAYAAVHITWMECKLITSMPYKENYSLPCPLLIYV